MAVACTHHQCIYNNRHRFVKVTGPVQFTSICVSFILVIDLPNTPNQDTYSDEKFTCRDVKGEILTTLCQIKNCRLTCGSCNERLKVMHQSNHCIESAKDEECKCGNNYRPTKPYTNPALLWSTRKRAPGVEATSNEIYPIGHVSQKFCRKDASIWGPLDVKGSRMND